MILEFSIQKTIWRRCSFGSRILLKSVVVWGSRSWSLWRRWRGLVDIKMMRYDARVLWVCECSDIPPDQSCEDAAFPMQAAEKIHKLFATKHSMNSAVNFMLTLKDTTKFVMLKLQSICLTNTIFANTAQFGNDLPRVVKMPMVQEGEIPFEMVWADYLEASGVKGCEHWWIYNISCRFVTYL